MDSNFLRYFSYMCVQPLGWYDLINQSRLACLYGCGQAGAEEQFLGADWAKEIDQARIILYRQTVPQRACDRHANLALRRAVTQVAGKRNDGSCACGVAFDRGNGRFSHRLQPADDPVQ